MDLLRQGELTLLIGGYNVGLECIYTQKIRNICFESRPLLLLGKRKSISIVCIVHKCFDVIAPSKYSIHFSTLCVSSAFRICYSATSSSMTIKIVFNEGENRHTSNLA